VTSKTLYDIDSKFGDDCILRCEVQITLMHLGVTFTVVKILGTLDNHM
jgi:hypothetical protein